MATPTRIAQLRRWALIGTALLMGVALLATAWSTNDAVREASATLIRGQADVFKDAIRVELGGSASLPSNADLVPILEQNADVGLRYIGLIDSDGTLISEAGTSVAPRATLERPVSNASAEPVEVGDRIRSVFRVPLFRRKGREFSFGGERRGRRHLPLLVIEFEPELADGLRDASRQALGIGALASGAFLIVALGLVRWFWRREALERALERERRLAAVGEMSAVLAHEIRNPLASLKGNAQLLARALSDSDKTRAKADRVVIEAIRLETLTNNLLEFVRAGEIQLVPTDPVGLLRDVAASISRDRIEVTADKPPATWPLDADRMRQVLTNLLANAVQAGGDAPVTASVSQQGGKLVFAIRDRGEGIAPDATGRLFEPFFTTRTRGTGLGLAVAKRIVDVHRGTITGENAADVGAIFRVELPRL